MTAEGARLIDSHAHLDFPEFEGQVDAVIERARAAGVVGIVTVGTTYDSARKALEIASQHEGVYAAAGIHPNDVAQHFSEFGAVARLFETESLVAVGETGLDFHWKDTPPSEQEKAFRAHLDLAVSRDLPVIIHVREAHAEALRVLDSLPRMPRGVFHCFSGTAEFAREVIARGFYISIAGPVTYKNANNLRATVATIPLERLLVETDCPYLAPVPHRGKTNEPAYVRATAEKVAEVIGAPFEEFARATTENAWALFGLRRQ